MSHQHEIDRGARYDAAGLADTVGRSGEFRLPERPRFVSDLLLLPHGSAAIHVVGGEEQTVRGESLPWVFGSVVPLLDGTRTISELLEELPGLAESILLDVVHLLHMSGLVEAGPQPHQTARQADADDRHGSQLVYFSRYLRVTGRHDSRHSVQEALDSATVTIAGSGLDAEQLAHDLGRVGIGDLRHVADLNMLPESGEPGLLVALGGSAMQRTAASFAASRQCVVLSVDPLRGQLGPLTYPRASACAVCVERQLPDHQSSLSDATSGGSDGLISRLWRRAIVARAAQQVVAHVTGLHHPRLLGHIERWSADDGRAWSTRVLVLPACPTCGEPSVPVTVTLQGGHDDNLALIHHRNVVLKPWQMHEPASQEAHFSAAAQTLMETSDLTFEGAERVDLEFPGEAEALGSTVGLWCDSVDARPRRALAVQQLAQLLRYSVGVRVVTRADGRTQLRRYTASGGNLGSPEIFAAVNNVPGLAAGLYHYRDIDDSLETLRPGRLSSSVEGVSHDAPVVLYILGALERLRVKYDSRAYLYCLLDAGLVMHRLELLAAAMGLRTQTFTTASVDDVVELLGVEPTQQPPCVVIGLWPARSEVA